eukprot:scaffold72113_cov82-Phaeocystis_antarctica.AAC.3
MHLALHDGDTTASRLGPCHLQRMALELCTSRLAHLLSDGNVHAAIAPLVPVSPDSKALVGDHERSWHLAGVEICTLPQRRNAAV